MSKELNGLLVTEVLDYGKGLAKRPVDVRTELENKLILVTAYSICLEAMLKRDEILFREGMTLGHNAADYWRKNNESNG